MEQQAPYAHLNESDKREISELESKLRRRLGREIILVAYERNEQGYV